MARSRLPAADWRESPLARILGPMQEFIHQSASGGIVLLGATVVAMILANSGLAEWYDEVLHTEIGVVFGRFELRESLLHWINDGLMAIFFFVVGLEIKREVIAGELSNLRAAMLPILAAAGGAIIPALIYLLVNPPGSPGADGWGIPMATDIAFALGCLALLGSRIPFGLKIFLTAVAIVDDLIAVLVIALFYSGGLNFTALGLGLLVLVVLGVLNLLGIRNTLVYTVLGFLVWLAFLKSGVHATIAGVLVALTIPARYTIDDRTFLRRAQLLLDDFQASEDAPSPMLTDERQQQLVLALEETAVAVQSPLQRMEHNLHTWISMGIMPIFALANAGVHISTEALATGSLGAAVGIVAGLVVGKPVGLMLTSWLAVKSGVATLPEGITWYHMLGASVLGGIGFTMSLFIATLGFGQGELLDTAKLGILIASVIAGVVGIALLSRLPANAEAGAISAVH